MEIVADAKLALVTAATAMTGDRRLGAPLASAERRRGSSARCLKRASRVFAATTPSTGLSAQAAGPCLLGSGAVPTYDPRLGARFLTRDPLVAQTMEPYAYAGNNPTNFTDPTGLYWGEGVVNKAKDAAGTAWDKTGGKAATAIEQKATDPHFWVDAGTGFVVAVGAGACIAATAGICVGAIGTAIGVGGVVAGGTVLGGAGHLAVNAATPGSEGDYGVYQSFGHGFVSSAFSAVCVVSIGASCLKSAFGFSAAGRLGQAAAGSVFTFGALTKSVIGYAQDVFDDNC